MKYEVQDLLSVLKGQIQGKVALRSLKLSKMAVYYIQKRVPLCRKNYEVEAILWECKHTDCRIIRGEESWEEQAVYGKYARLKPTRHKPA